MASANDRCCRSVAAGRVGANRIVLFDSDWNPATDEQARRGRKRDGWGVLGILARWSGLVCAHPHVQ